MAVQPIEFNEALTALAQRQRSGALSQAEFRQQRRQLLALLMATAEPAATRQPDAVPPAERAASVPQSTLAPSRKLLVAALLLASLLVLVLVAT